MDTETAGLMSDANVDDAICDMDLSHFHPDVSIQKDLRTITWRHRGVFKGLGHI